MSYILDSLKKSEQKRKQQELPGLHSEPLGAASRRPESRRVWPVVLIVVLLANAGLLGWYLYQVNPAPAPVPAVSVIPDPAVPAPARPPAEPARSMPDQELSAPVAPPVAPAVPAVEARPATVDHPPVTTEMPRRETRLETIETPVATAPLSLQQLPQSTRRQLPEMLLSLHYFPGPGQTGMIRLDGVILRVGDQVQEGLTVQEIVAEGVIFDYRGQLIWLDRPRG